MSDQAFINEIVRRAVNYATEAALRGRPVNLEWHPSHSAAADSFGFFVSSERGPK